MPPSKKPTGKTPAKKAKTTPPKAPVEREDVLPALGPLPNLRIVTVTLDMDDPEQPVEVSYDEKGMSRLEVHGMLDVARMKMGASAWGEHWDGGSD